MQTQDTTSTDAEIRERTDRLGTVNEDGTRSKANKHELAKYRCHKDVRAARIETVEPDATAVRGTQAGPFLVLLSDPTFTGSPDDTPMVRQDVTVKWMTKHSPEVGGYFVAYEDGYTSYRPAKAFEAGYTLIEIGA